MAKTYLFWDPLSDSILQERDETGVVTAEYTAEPGLYGNVISQNRGGAESRFHYDAQGSTLAVTDDNQQVTDTRAYSAFGETTDGAGSTSFPFQYIGQCGYYQGNLTGQYLVRRRPYDPARTRWCSVDPLPVRGRSAYAYASNCPATMTDPSGLILPQPQEPRTPMSPGVEIDSGQCEKLYTDYVVYHESRAGRGDWQPLVLMNVKAWGFRLDRSCTGKTHRLAITVFETIRAGSIAPGIPIVDETHESAPLHFDALAVDSSCSEVSRVTRFQAPGPGGGGATWYTDINFDCFSPCDTCKRCVSANHRALLTFANSLAPPVDIRWTFTPTDQLPDCRYDECTITLKVRQV